MRFGHARFFLSEIRFTVKRIIGVLSRLSCGGQGLQHLMGGIGRVGFHLVHGGIGLLLLVGDYCLLCFGELLSCRLNRPVSAGLLDDLFRRSFPGRLVLQRIGFITDGFLAPGLFRFATLHISRVPVLCSSAGKAPCPAGSYSQKE